MTAKEIAHSIIDSFTEKQLKGFVDLFNESEPDIDDRSTETILESLAMDYIEHYSSTRYREGIDDQILGFLEYGCSYITAHLYAYRRALIETETKFSWILKLIKEGCSINEAYMILPISKEEFKKMAELLRAKNLIE